MPPFRDPFNYNFDPLIPLDVEAVGTAMHQRLVEEGKGGSVQRSGSNYSTWWNGGLRTEAYFHNMIGLLTEIIGNPTPMQIPLVADKQLPTGDWPLPIAPQPWHYRQSIDYEMTNNRAVYGLCLAQPRNASLQCLSHGSPFHRQRQRRPLDHHARPHRRTQSGARPTQAKVRISIRHRSSRSANLEIARAISSPPIKPISPPPRNSSMLCSRTASPFSSHDSPFSAGAQKFPANSYVVKTAQAFRPHVLDMFEPQHHPNDFQYPGGPPIPPYDSAGWTLALQMGVQFSRIMDGVSGPFT